MVVMKLVVKVSSEKRSNKQLFPTPDKYNKTVRTQHPKKKQNNELTLFHQSLLLYFHLTQYSLY